MCSISYVLLFFLSVYAWSAVFRNIRDVLEYGEWTEILFYVVLYVLGFACLAQLYLACPPSESEYKFVTNIDKYDTFSALFLPAGFAVILAFLYAIIMGTIDYIFGDEEEEYREAEENPIVKTQNEKD